MRAATPITRSDRTADERHALAKRCGDARQAARAQGLELQILRDRVLRDDERVVRQRREWYRMDRCGEVSLDGLEGKAPLIAAAIDGG